MTHPLAIVQNKLDVGDICEIDHSRVMGKVHKRDKDQYIFLGFKYCNHAGGQLGDGCAECKGKMKFENMRTHKTSSSCYGYKKDTPIVLVLKPLPDDLFEI